MSKKPKSAINSGRGDDNWAPGQKADGAINIMTPEEALKSIGERDADEAALSEAFGDEDDISDLD